MSNKLRINYSTAKTIVQTFRREKRFITREKIIINSKREEKLCKKNLNLLGKKRVEWLTLNILNEYDPVSKGYPKNLNLNEPIKSQENKEIFSIDKYSQMTSLHIPTGIITGNFIKEDLQKVKYTNQLDESSKKNASLNVMFPNLIQQEAHQIKAIKKLRDCSLEEISKTQIEEDNIKRSIETTTNDLLFFTPLGDIFYIIDENEGFMQYNNEIDFNNMVHLRKKIVKSNEFEPFIASRKLPIIDFLSNPSYLLSQFHNSNKILNNYRYLKFNFVPYKEKILHDFFRRKNINHLVFSLKNDQVFLPIPGPLYIRDLLKKELDFTGQLDFVVQQEELF